MGIFLSFVAGLVVWLVLWATGAKSFDAFLITILFVIIAAAFHIAWPYLPGNRREGKPGDGWAPR
jgi:hypothetical protein